MPLIPVACPAGVTSPPCWNEVFQSGMSGYRVSMVERRTEPEQSVHENGGLDALIPSHLTSATCVTG